MRWTPSNSIFATLVITIIFITTSGCTIYKSEGRKTFETQSPGQIRALSLIECTDNMNFSPQDFDQVEYTENGHEVFVSFYGNKIHARVSFINTQPQQSCTYLADNPEEWEKIKEHFYTEIDVIQNEVF